MPLSALSAAARGGSVLDRIANPPQVNVLGAFQNAAQAAGSIYDVQQKQATRAAGEAFLNSIDQATGLPRQSNFLLGLKADPTTAMVAQDAAQRGLTLDTGTYALHTARMGRAADAIGTLIGRYPNGIPQEAAHAAIQQEVDSGLITPAEAEQLRPQFGADPRQNSIVATQLYSHNMTNQQQLDRIYGTRAAVSTGSSTEFKTVPPPGPGQPDVSVPHTLTPGEQAEYQKWLQGEVEMPDPNNPGGKLKGTRLQHFERMGVDPKLFYPGGGGGSPAGGSSTLPPTLRNPPAKPSSGTPLPVPSPSDIDEFKTISDKAVASRDRSAILGNMLSDVGQFTTGPLADITSRMRNMGIALGIKGLSVEGQSAQESFNKLAAQLANAQGATSDQRLNINVAANPHQELSPAGATLMIHQLQGNEDYLQARAKLAAAYPGQNVKKFESEIGTKLDPRAFQYGRMSVPERQAWVKNLSDTDRTAVQKAYNWAVEQKVIAGE